MLRLCWVPLLISLGCDSARAADFYVAPDGNDAWSGSRPAVNAERTDGPLATLQRARDAVRKQKAADPARAITVYIRGGLYALPQTLKLEAQDSGTAAAPVVYRAYQNEKPVLIGGREITGFVPHKGSILKADLNALGLKGHYFRQLIFDGRRQHLARWPDYDPQNPYGGGWAYVDGKLVPMYQEIPGEDRRTLIYKASDTRSWSRPTDGEVFIFPRYNWWNNIVKIRSLDPQQRKITLTGDASYPIRPGDRYYVRNLMEELDAPGEWYLDRETWTLYFWPPKTVGWDKRSAGPPSPSSPAVADGGPALRLSHPTGNHPAGNPVYAPTMRTILELGPKTAHVIFRGLTFECCEGTAIVLKNTEACTIAGCTIRNAGDYHGSGVSIDGGRGNGVAGCDIFEIGSHGISLSGGDRKTLTAAENYADNNYIHHVGVFYKQGVGIALHGVGNRASRNLIHDGPRMGIMFGGNNLVIEYNHIRHMNLETEDTGAVYTGGRDWISSRGTLIRGNYFHDILGYGREGDKWVSPHFAWGVYLDDNAGGVDVIGNIVVRCPRAGLHLHNGRDNKIENNIFIESRLQQIEYNGWTREHRYWTNHLDTMIQGYEMVANQPAWQKMRNMDVHPKDAVLPDGKIMSGNVFRKNIIFYRDPEAKLFSFRNVSWDHYESDYNLVWHFGRPLLTGQTGAGKPISENLVLNPSFETGRAGALPKDWSWQMRPQGANAGQVEGDAARGKRALMMTGGVGKEPNGREFHPQVVSADLAVKPGHAYRLAARMKADKSGAKATLMLQSYVPNAYFWASSPNQVKVGTDWTACEFVFKTPAPGERGYHEQMKKFRVRIDFAEKSGTLRIDDVSLCEVEMLDEWKAWQAMGFDEHSLVADPKFVDPDKDDYRLKPDSPALELGFHPIPVERIGPYRDELRATWPIVEAEGAREKPLGASPHR